jgi:hypothetical protein
MSSKEARRETADEGTSRSEASSPPPPDDALRRERISAYLTAASGLESTLEKKRLEQMRDPSKHLKHEAAWSQFYLRKCAAGEGGPVAVTEEITAEWEGVWADLFLRYRTVLLLLLMMMMMMMCGRESGRTCSSGIVQCCCC